MESILTSIKKLLGITENYTQFDTDLIIHINSVFFILKDLGVGPSKGFRIKDATAKWSDFLPEEDTWEAVKSYMYLKVKLIFDPPVGSALESANRLISEFEWRLKEDADDIRRMEAKNVDEDII